MLEVCQPAVLLTCRYNVLIGINSAVFINTFSVNVFSALVG